MKKISHDGIQSELFLYTWNKYPQTRRCMWHTPNELIPDNFIQREAELYLKRTGITAPKWLLQIFSNAKKQFQIWLTKRKAIGVLPGVTDLVLYRKGILYIFDIKVGKDKLSDAQLKFIDAIEAQGGKFYEINSYEQGVEIIDYICK